VETEDDVSPKEQLQRNVRGCAALLRRLLRFHPEHAPAELRQPATCSTRRQAPTGPHGTIEAIIHAAAAHYEIAVADLLERRRGKPVATARQVAIYLARQLTTRSLSQIAKQFGRRDHTTILHAVRKIEHQRQEDPEFSRVVDDLAAQIRVRRRRAA
jgi:chromosomal replication initiation ATPase DnaA